MGAGEIINDAAKNKAPAFNRGIQGIDTAKLLSQADSGQIKALMADSFALWSMMSGIEVDSKPFSFEARRYLLPIYLDQSQEVVWMKAAQLGATIYMLLRLLWYARYNTVNVALYFPTSDGVEKLAKARLNPLIKSNEELYGNLTGTDTLGVKMMNNIHGKNSNIYMLYVGGVASKDSTPLDILAFDEVRLIDQGDIDQTMERIAASDHKIRIYMSTAGFPDNDIHARYLRGTQLTFHSVCGCPDGVILPDVFPDCIVDTGKEVYYRCPKCKYRINDVQNGCYIPHNPGANFPSYSVSQLNSSKMAPADLWEFFNTTTNIREFYNSKLGRPYVDEDSRPVSDDVFDSCINENAKWLMESAARKVKGGCAMGVDQHSGNCYVVISKRGKDGKKQVAHVELIESANPQYWEYNEEKGEDAPVSPFKRLYELIREFNVQMCVIDAMPNINEAKDFARAFPRKVFLAHYKDAGQDMVLWYDRAKTKEAVRKSSKETRMKWQCLLHRYDSLDYALRQWTENIIEIPPLGRLTQIVRNPSTGRFEAENLAVRLKEHLKRLVRQETVLNEETGRSKMEWIYLGGDPHFAHAFNYCNIAMERLKHKPMVFF